MSHSECQDFKSDGGMSQKNAARESWFRAPSNVILRCQSLTLVSRLPTKSGSYAFPPRTYLACLLESIDIAVHLQTHSTSHTFLTPAHPGLELYYCWTLTPENYLDTWPQKGQG